MLARAGKELANDDAIAVIYWQMLYISRSSRLGSDLCSHPQHNIVPTIIKENSMIKSNGKKIILFILSRNLILFILTAKKMSKVEPYILFKTCYIGNS